MPVETERKAKEYPSVNGKGVLHCVSEEDVVADRNVGGWKALGYDVEGGLVVVAGGWCCSVGIRSRLSSLRSCQADPSLNSTLCGAYFALCTVILVPLAESQLGFFRGL